MLSAPVGHRVKFTVNPHEFDLQNAGENECTDDFLEVRDGPAPDSPLLGRFCNQDPPSSLFSTDSHLFVRFVTDSYAPSEGWSAVYELARCGGTLVLRQDTNNSITSTNFPDAYPTHEHCEWVVKAPRGHFVEGK